MLKKYRVKLCPDCLEIIRQEEAETKRAYRRRLKIKLVGKQEKGKVKIKKI